MRSAARWLRAWTPAPSSARTPASDLASAFVAAAETAAVRSSVISRPSIIASGAPVAGSQSRITAMCVGSPRPAFAV